ncbi:hypothetical protein HDV00_006833 [Rhizophlyctis rosea]|nr:hypothetical protein HDV00_006833 [Rhizophlyctis rosea]
MATQASSETAPSPPAKPSTEKPFSFNQYARDMASTDTNNKTEAPTARKRKRQLDDVGVEIISSDSDAGSDSDEEGDDQILFNNVVGKDYVPPRSAPSPVKSVSGFSHGRKGPPASDFGGSSDGTLPWVGRRYNGTLEERLSAEIEDFVRYIAPSPKEESIREGVVDSYNGLIRDAKQQKWQVQNRSADISKAGPTIAPFGSFATKLYLPDADLDLVLLDPEGQTEPGQGNMSSNLSKYMRYLRPSASDLFLIKRAKIPIIKLHDYLTGLQVDISYNQTGGLGGADRVRELLDELPALRPLCFVMKQFLHIRKLNDVATGGLGGYSLVLWLAAFIRIHPSVYPDRYTGNSSPSLGALLLDFWQLFGFSFDYVHMSLSASGGPDKSNPVYIFDKQSRDWKRVPSQAYLLSLEDANDPFNDVSSNTTRIVEITTQLAYSYNCVQEAFEAGDSSLLGAVMRVPVETQQFRRAFREGRGGEVYRQQRGQARAAAPPPKKKTKVQHVTPNSGPSGTAMVPSPKGRGRGGSPRGGSAGGRGAGGRGGGNGANRGGHGAPNGVPPAMVAGPSPNGRGRGGSPRGYSGGVVVGRGAGGRGASAAIRGGGGGRGGPGGNGGGRGANVGNRGGRGGIPHGGGYGRGGGRFNWNDSFIQFAQGSSGGGRGNHTRGRGYY